MNRSRIYRPRAVASEDYGTLTSQEEKVKLGGSELKVTRLGIGAWSWGDNSYWNNFEWDDRMMKAAKAAFDAGVDRGITFVDTAEVYGSSFALGAISSETLLGRFIKERKKKDPEVDIAVATKFAALPWRFGRQSVISALKSSLSRLGLESVDLYQLHWPGIWGNEGYIDGLGDAVEQGLVKAVGVSNYSEKRLRDAHEKLKKRGIPLASNQVNYSLIYRLPEENGVKATCDELGITLIAYSPIAQGVLTGKYSPENPPTGPRGRIYTPEFLTKLQPLLNRIRAIGENYNKTPTQVVLNWLIAQENVVPIPVNSSMQSSLFQDNQSSNAIPPLPPGFNGGLGGLSSQGLSGQGVLSSQGLSSQGGLSGQVPPLPPGLNGLDLTNLNGLNASSTLAPSLSRLGSIGSTTSNSSRDAPPLPPGYNDNSSVWSQPPLPASNGSPQKISLQPPLPPGSESPLQRSPHPFRDESPVKSPSPPPLPSSAESPQKKTLQPPAAFAIKQSDVPTQAMLALVPEFTFYHDRPMELPKESDRVRKAMFARMLNHMDELPKATLCPLQPGHDPSCPLSHTYMEVMAYNPLYKRLVCRQPSHYWGSQIQEDESCVCVHVDTGVTWEWMDESRDKRLYCLRGAKCTNNKCLKSHSFEEMCWYNPSYKIKRCTVRAHDHIARARGTIAPPLDCSYYHIEEGKNADKREFTAEYDHVGKDIKMLFIERSHKPLADRLEALRYARANNL